MDVNKFPLSVKNAIMNQLKGLKCMTASNSLGKR